MRYCVICHKKAVPGNGTFFNAPRDPELRAVWDELCKKKFNTSTRICMDHFAKDDIITSGSRFMLLPKAMPIFPKEEEVPVTTSYTENSRSPFPIESDEFVLPDTSAHGLRYFTYEELTTTAASKCPEPQVEMQESQTEPSSLDMVSTKCKKKVRLLQAANKKLRFQLRQANLAIKATKKIFTDEQIRCLMRTGNIKWKWKDISSAAYLQAAAPRAYNHLHKKGLPLPDVTTLHRWYRLKNHQKLNRHTNGK